MNGLFQRLFYATGCAFELARGVIIFSVLLVLVNIFIGTINIVNGPSMEPNFYNRQMLVVDKLSYLFRGPRRGEVVILKFPGDPLAVRYIKRVVGLPNETIKIEDNKVYIDGKLLDETAYIPEDFSTKPNLELKMGPDEYFFLGDNRENSSDSRYFKGVEKRFLIGLAYVVIYPFHQAGLVPPQYYNLPDQKSSL